MASEPRTPDSDATLVVVHTPFRGDIGLGIVLHVERPGPFAWTRAEAQAHEIAEDLSWGQLLTIPWIGNREDCVPAPREGQFVLFDEAYAAPPWHAGKLVKELRRDIADESRGLELAQDLDTEQ